MNLTLADIERAAGDAAMVSGGGFIDTPNQRLPVRHVSTIVTADDLARSVVAFRDGAPLRLGDVAEVVEGHPPPIGDAIINDVPGLLLIVEKQPTGNTLDVTRNVEAALDEMKPGLTGHSGRLDDLPAGHVHRDVAGESRLGDDHRLRAGDRDPGRCSCATGGRP